MKHHVSLALLLTLLAALTLALLPPIANEPHYLFHSKDDCTESVQQSSPPLDMTELALINTASRTAELGLGRLEFFSRGYPNLQVELTDPGGVRATKETEAPGALAAYPLPRGGVTCLRCPTAVALLDGSAAWSWSCSPSNE